MIQMSHMTARRLRGALLLCLPCGVIGAQASQDPKQCYGVRPPSATFGIGHYNCYGSGCIVNGRVGDGYAHVFTTEPSVSEIAPNGPSAGRLRDGDVIVLIDSALVTSSEGGRRLANPEAGRPVTLLIRRGESQQSVTVTPAPGCEIPSLAVTAGNDGTRAVPRKQADGARPSSPPDFGMRLECGACGWRTSPGGELRWFATKSPVVVDVVAGGPAEGAGVKRGDVLDALGGASFVAPDGSGEMAAVRAGVPTTLVVRRLGVEMRLRITPRATP
jgi:hypothetical protein